MNGNAPNWPVTGSQVAVRQKAAPNRSMDGIDWRTSTAPIAHTIAMRSRPNAPVPNRNPKSQLLRPRIRTALRRLHRRQRRQFELDDGIRQRSVAEGGAVRLTVSERPLQEVDHDSGLQLVRRIFIEQQPRER